MKINFSVEIYNKSNQKPASCLGYDTCQQTDRQTNRIFQS